MDSSSKVLLHTGRAMPIIGLGTWQLTETTADVIAEALRMGYRMIDTSGDYGTQPGIGKGISQSGFRREEVFITTKVEETDDAHEATKQNLAELDSDYVDLTLIHRPPQDGVGIELWQGLIRAQQDGLTRDIGVSNYSVEQIQQLIDATKVVPVVNQIEWTPFGHSREMLGYCQENSIIIQAYSPLTRGDKVNDATLDSIAHHYGKTPAQILIRWNLQLGTVPLPKANRVEHVRENIDIFDFALSDHDMQALSSLNREYSVLGALQYLAP